MNIVFKFFWQAFQEVLTIEACQKIMKMINDNLLKLIYSEKATKFWEISTLLLTVSIVKSKLEISQTFVAFSEYMNFTKKDSN